MNSQNFIVVLSIILLSTKFLGIISKKFNIPQVVGALLAGLILGPSCLGIVHETNIIKELAELGVILLMFSAGLETDLKELKKCGKASFIIALAGVTIPLLGGFIVACIFNNPGKIFIGSTCKILENIFIGVILTATSVSITVETLQEMGKLKTPSGTAILGAAIIDDILGIIILTIITGMSNPSINISFVLLKIVAFFILSIPIAIIFTFLFKKLWHINGKSRTIPILALSFCLIMSFVSEYYFGVASITGAYMAGVIISQTEAYKYVEKKIHIVSYMFLSPIFFANIGINTSISHMNFTLIMFTIVLTIVAILTKVYGCKLGAKFYGYSNDDSLKIGIGMVSRGEVALIISNIGISAKILQTKFFAPIILVVIITTLITPILLKIIYQEKQPFENNFEKAS